MCGSILLFFGSVQALNLYCAERIWCNYNCINCVGACTTHLFARNDACKPVIWQYFVKENAMSIFIPISIIASLISVEVALKSPCCKSRLLCPMCCTETRTKDFPKALAIKKDWCLSSNTFCALSLTMTGGLSALSFARCQVKGWQPVFHSLSRALKLFHNDYINSSKFCPFPWPDCFSTSRSSPLYLHTLFSFWVF